MKKTLNKMLHGYRSFRKKYASGDNTVMQQLSDHGQQPEIMVISCCDSRVDPALILQCDPGDLFVVRNIANIVPPYEKDEAHHGTSAALEYGICFLKVKHLILLGHSQCGGIQMLLSKQQAAPNDFISNWVSIVKTPSDDGHDANEYAKLALHDSLTNCLTFPWLKAALEKNELNIHLWFFDVQKGQVFNYAKEAGEYQPLESVADLI